VPPSAWGWLPLLTGVAVAEALRAATGVDVRLKWPNDAVVDGPDRDGGPGPRKLAGVLLEQVPATGAAVVGLGLNVDLTAPECPTPAATSLLLETTSVPGVPTSLPQREGLLAGLLVELGRRYRTWAAAGGDPVRCGLAGDYRARCLTLGREVVASRPGGVVTRGVAVDLSRDGGLLVRSSQGDVTVSAGDVEHLR
jgi:BirA family biotin operon repressor/biotin-[acetyl-CoA-carboxylase] ligase